MLIFKDFTQKLYLLIYSFGCRLFEVRPHGTINSCNAVEMVEYLDSYTQAGPFYFDMELRLVNNFTLQVKNSLYLLHCINVGVLKYVQVGCRAFVTASILF